MTRILPILLLFILSIQTKGQGIVNIGIKYGTNSSVMLTNFDEVIIQNINETSINNYLAGAFVRINAGRLHVQPEAYFNTKGGIITPVSSNELSIPTATNFNYQTIDVPVLLGYKLVSRELINLRLHVGPVFSYVTANSLFSEISDLRNTDMVNRYVGWQIGAGVDVWFITLDARIENSGNVLANESRYTASNRVYLMSAGIKLF